MRSSSNSHAHTSSKSHGAELSKKSLQHQILAAKARVSEKEEEEEQDDAEHDEASEDGVYADGEEAIIYDEEYFKRRRREMSPTELYFCAICSTAKGSTKSSHDHC